MRLFRVVARYDAVTDYVLWVSADSQAEALARAQASAQPWTAAGSSELALRSLTAILADENPDEEWSHVA